MTREEREEAIELLEKEKAYMLGHGGDTQANALNMVIQALEQQNELFKMGLLKDCESCKAQSINFMCCDDVISREKAKQFLYERIDRLNNDELYDIFSRIIDDMYNELPSVTPRPFINKPCVSEGVCREDKIQVLDKIRAEIKGWQVDIHDNENDADKHDFVFERIFEIIDENKAESEE